jgi:hypothetical protein
MEVNANPSMNVYSDQELPNGDIEQTLSELDKYVKSLLISDTFKLVTSENSESIMELGCLKRILPAENATFEDFYIYSEAESIFQKLSGIKVCDYISSS